MFKEKRPTCVTVIGWAWIIVGGLMCLSAIMGLFGSIMMWRMARSHPDEPQKIPIFLKVFPFLAILQIGVAVLGVVAGINFLQLKKWSRGVLEVLSWLGLAFIICSGIFWLFNWVSMASGGGPPGFDIMGAVMGVIITGMYAIPLAVMIKYLRGQRVRSALNASTEPSARTDATPQNSSNETP